LGWQIEFDADVEKDFRKIDKQSQKRIIEYLRSRVLNSDDPRRLGKALQGKLSGLWRYRVGDYRIICKIEDKKCVVLVIAIGQRKNIYNII
jgi:mRNA interferase RelE/StbE